MGTTIENLILLGSFIAPAPSPWRGLLFASQSRQLSCSGGHFRPLSRCNKILVVPKLDATGRYKIPDRTRREAQDFADGARIQETCPAKALEVSRGNESHLRQLLPEFPSLIGDRPANQVLFDRRDPGEPPIS